MPRDIEAELRRSLQARAADVTPDPAMYARVQARIRRGRTFRFALAGAAAALAVTGVAVAAPRLMDRVIEFEPPAVATQPAPEATPEATEPAPAATTGDSRLVFTDGNAVQGIALDGESAETLMAFGCPAGAECEEIGSVAAFADGGDSGAVTSVAVTCDGVRYSRGAGNVSSLPVDNGTCATSVAFSPDGTHLAWITEPDGGGEPMLHTVDWSATGPGTDDASFGLPWAGASEVSIQDWVWTEDGSDTASGYLALRARREGVIQMLRMPIERQADGAIGVTWEASPVEARPGFVPVAFAASGSAVTHTLEVLQEPDGLTGASVVRRIGSEIDDEIAVPDELFDSPNFNESDLWMSDNGAAVVFGNAGSGRAWYVEYGMGRSTPVPLNATIIHADLLLTTTQPAGPGETESELAATTEVEVYFGMTGADACVADHPVTREVVSPGVARGAITELLAGPSSRESNEGITSGFTANTAGALNDIEIVDGQARVDFDDFSAVVETDSCTKSAILDSLDKTLLQFPTVTSTQYSFGGDVQAWEDWLGESGDAVPQPPQPVQDTAQAVRELAEARNYDGLRDYMPPTFACMYSDQQSPDDCIAYWQDLEAQGQDPLGRLAKLLSGLPAPIEEAGMWVWPPQWADPDSSYSGHRVGIAEDGTWRYFNPPGG